MTLPKTGYSSSGIIRPGGKAAEITPSDVADLQEFSRAIYVGTTGDIKVEMGEDDSVVTFKDVQGGSLLPITVQKVFATGTTATNIVALF